MLDFANITESNINQVISSAIAELNSSNSHLVKYFQADIEEAKNFDAEIEVIKKWFSNFERPMTFREAIDLMKKAEWDIEENKLQYLSDGSACTLRQKGRAEWYVTRLGIDFYRYNK